MAEASKDAGNAAFRLADYPLALAHYSTAIQIDPSNHTYPLNRSLVYLKTSKWKEAEKDATTALKLQPGTAKAYFRRGLARKGAGEIKGAKEDFESAKKAGAGEEVDKELRELAAAQPSSKTKFIPSAAATTKLPPSTSKSPPSAPKSTDSRTDRLRAALSTPQSTKPSSAPSASLDNSNSAAPISSASTAPAPKPSPPPASASTATSSPSPKYTSVSGLMEAVSTRRLTKAAASPAAPKPDETPSNPFAAKKKEREVKSRALGSTGVAGFKAERKQEQEESRFEELPPSLTAVGPTPALNRPTPSAHPQVPLSFLPTSSPALPPPPAAASAPTTAAAFEHAFLSARTPEARLALLRSLPLVDLPKLFGSSLTPDLLSEIITTLLHASPADSAASNAADVALLEWQLPFLRSLTGVNRFGTVVGFMDETEKEGIRMILKKGREAMTKLGSDWEV